MFILIKSFEFFEFLNMLNFQMESFDWSGDTSYQDQVNGFVSTIRINWLARVDLIGFASNLWLLGIGDGPIQCPTSQSLKNKTLILRLDL